MNDTIILAEARGDFITGIKWQANGKAEIMGGKREDAIRYTPEEAQELIQSLGCGYSAEFFADWCYYINPCQDPELFGGYVPSRVDRDQPGHAPMIGKEDQAPWVWGKTLAEAEATCEAVNKKMGIDSKEAFRIVASSMFKKEAV